MISNKMEYYRWNMGAKIPTLTKCTDAKEKQT